MSDKVSVVIFEGGNWQSPPEEMLGRVRHAVLLDNLEKMKRVAEVGNIYLITNFPELADEAAQRGALVNCNALSLEEFHFGLKLQELILSKKLQHVFYIGGASVPLIKEEEIQWICRQLLERKPVLLTNNSQSADVVAFSPATMVQGMALPPMDNVLAKYLCDHAGVEQELIPNSAGILFDLDTPTDMLFLASSSYLGPRARRVLAQTPLELSRFKEARAVLEDEYKEVMLLGRVGAPIIAHINKHLKCRLRVFSEERGMKALGRDVAGEVISLMGLLLEEVGLDRFFYYIEQVADCAFIDTRVIFAHKKLNPSPADRFYSDLGSWEKIKDPFIRDFTRKAVQASIPIILGGHSLVLGGLWALVDEIGPLH